MPTYVRGIYNFSPTAPDDLPFKAGDTIKVIDTSHKDWWRGSLGDKSGTFPVNYVEPVPEAEIASLANSPATVSKPTSVQALFSFASADPVDLSFQEGDRIELIDTRHKDWWIGKLGSGSGVFPADHVKRASDQITRALSGALRPSTSAWSAHKLCYRQAYSATLPFSADLLRRLTLFPSLDASTQPEEMLAVDFSPEGACSDPLTFEHNLKLYSISLRDLCVSPARATSGTPELPRRFSSFYHRATTIAENHLVLLSNDFALLYKLNLSSREWSYVTIIGPLPPKRQGASLAVCPSTQFILFGGLCGGHRKGVCVNDLWMLNIGLSLGSSLPSWKRCNPSPSSDIPDPRHKHTLTSRGQKLYLFGGENTASGEILSDTLEFDLLARKWTKLTCSGEAIPRAGHTAVVIEDSMYVFGGSANRLPHLSVFNIPSSTWCCLTNSTLGRSGRLSAQPMMVPFASKILFFVMQPSVDSTTNVHMLDTARIHFDQLPALPSLVLNDCDLVEIHKPVGGGGYCDLFVGIHLTSKVKLALKRPRLFETEDQMANAIRRFRREAHLWSAFRHINILPFLGVLEKGDEIYLTSCWMARGDLSKFLKSRSQYCQKPDPTHPNYEHHSSFNERDMMLGIASGIAYLHSRDFVHGDVKSPNVVLADDGRPLLCDFGLTKALDAHFGDTSTTMKGVGSRRWQSPELFLNKPKSFKSDVYAFAMTVVEILTCVHPFPTFQDSAVPFAVLLKHERPPFEPASRLGVNYEPFWQLASRCWSQEAGDRLSMKEVVEVLEQIPSQTR